MYDELKDKRVVVTGSSGGIGAGIARAFAEHGACVLVHYCGREAGAQATAKAVRAAGGTPLICRADLKNDKGIADLFKVLDAEWGGLDVLVNNAGIVFKGAILDMTAAHWDDTLNINLRAPFLLSREAAKRMVAQGDGGVILHNCSIHGSASCEYFSAYGAAKAGLKMLTTVQALEWGEHGIRVNSFSPGVIPVERQAESLEKEKAKWLPHIPLKRFGNVDDVAGLCLFLASDQASWITGEDIVCDGGTLARIHLPQRKKPTINP